MHRTSTSRTTDTTLHRISQAAPHVLHNCIVPSHQTVVTPSSTSHYHVSHNFPHHTSVHHHFLHPTTYHISHNTTSTTRYRTVSRPTLYLIPHRTTFHIPCHSTHSTSFHIAQRSTFRATAHTPIHCNRVYLHIVFVLYVLCVCRSVGVLSCVFVIRSFTYVLRVVI